MARAGAHRNLSWEEQLRVLRLLRQLHPGRGRPVALSNHPGPAGPFVSCLRPRHFSAPPPFPFLSPSLSTVSHPVWVLSTRRVWFVQISIGGAGDGADPVATGVLRGEILVHILQERLEMDGDPSRYHAAHLNCFAAGSWQNRCARACVCVCARGVFGVFGLLPFVEGIVALS